MSNPDKVERPLLRTLGNALSDVRLEGFSTIADEIIYRQERYGKFRGWGLAVIAAGLFSTDYFDGKLVRASNLPNPGGGLKDERNDKEALRQVYGALRVATGDSRYAIYNKATEIRNHLVEREREKLREAGLSADARKLGKIKMWAQASAVVADLSPLGDSNPEAVHGMHVSAIGFVILSGVDFKWHADWQLAPLEWETVEAPAATSPAPID